jgi:hypothetical protein
VLAGERKRRNPDSLALTDVVASLVLAGERKSKESRLTDRRRRRPENRKALVVLAGERRRKESRLARTDGHVAARRTEKALVVLTGERRKEFCLARTNGRRRRPSARRRKESRLARTNGRRRRPENKKTLVVLAGERRRSSH